LNFGPHYAASILSGRFNESVGADHPRLLKAIKQAGHEIGLHGYDHFWWAENIWDASEERVRMDMERAIGVFRHTAGFEPSAWASPNWRCSVSSIKFVDDHPFAYGADCRGTEAFFPKIDGYIGRKIQIPITLPCLHEIRNYMSSADPKHIMKEFISRLKNGLNVWCIHDYYEGVLERKLFSGLIERLKSDGWTFTPLIELVNSINPKTVPVVEIERRSLPGGRGNVSCQAAQV
jgi:undecaprenyl phosphate-alpha-L-ara4FN deformylase